MRPAIANIYRRHVSLIALRCSCVRFNKRQSCHHQDDERYDMGHSCQTEKPHLRPDIYFALQKKANVSKGQGYISLQ
jgi:hypothetical protein